MASGGGGGGVHVLRVLRVAHGVKDALPQSVRQHRRTTIATRSRGCCIASSIRCGRRHQSRVLSPGHAFNGGGAPAGGRRGGKAGKVGGAFHGVAEERVVLDAEVVARQPREDQGRRTAAVLKHGAAARRLVQIALDDGPLLGVHHVARAAQLQHLERRPQKDLQRYAHGKSRALGKHGERCARFSLFLLLLGILLGGRRKRVVLPSRGGQL
mmetsp:Transcript_12661/g.24984  ORF Transcript_12661/g.24984 Transcript_12661/m.24984 type:complete len:212 (+) Transcript_12661:734-1369(+)